MPTSVGVLGPIIAERDGTPLPLDGRIAPRVLAVLIAMDAPVPSDRLVDLVWGRRPPATAASALRVHVTKLRQVLGSDAITTTHRGYAVGPELEVDLRSWDRLLSLAPGSSPSSEVTLARLDAALRLWRGEPWEGIDDIAPILDARRELIARRLEAEDTWAGLLTSGPDVGTRIGDLRRLAHAEPLREVRWAALIEGLHRVGREGEAMRAYEEARTALAENLGTSPGRRIQDAYDAVVAGARAGDRPPVHVTPLVGRRDDVDRVESALRQARLVTVTGIGGVGKTRLVAEVDDRARRVGLLTCWLRAPEDPSPRRFLRGLSTQLGIRAPSEEDALDALTARLAGVELLVLDGLEAEGAQVASLVARLLRHRPRVGILASRREPIGLTEEEVIPLSPLTVPVDGASPRGTAVELLARLRGEWSADLSAEQVGRLARECRAVGGIPLLIALQARQRATYPSAAAPETDLLAIGPLVEDLDGPLRDVAHIVAVLPAGLTSAATAAHSEVVNPHRWLAFLTWSGLVQTETSGTAVRHTMLDPIREHLLRGVAADEVAQIWDRHRAHLRAQGRRVRPAWDQPPDYAELVGLEAEDSNITTLLDQGGAEGLDTVESLASYLGCRGHAANGLEWLRADLDGDDPARAARAALCSARIGRFSDAIVPLSTRLAQAFDHFSETGDAVRATAVGIYSTLAEAYRGGPVPARRSVARLDPLRADATPWTRAMIDAAEGFVALLEGARDSALVLLFGAEDVFEPDDPGGRAMVCYLRGVFSVLREGETPRQVRERAARAAAAAGDLPLIGLCLFAEIADATTVEGTIVAARRAATALDAGGLLGWAAQARLTAARTLIDSGDPDAAVSDLLAALGPLRRSRSHATALALSGLAVGIAGRSSSLAGELAAASVVARRDDDPDAPTIDSWLRTLDRPPADLPDALGASQLDDLLARVAAHAES